MTIKVSEDTMLEYSISEFVESMRSQITEFLEVLTEKDEPRHTKEEYQELCKDIKIDIPNTSEYQNNGIGFL